MDCLQGGNTSRARIFCDLDRWLSEGLEIAIARVVNVDGSAPQQAGATMAVTANSEIAGSVAGGCVESAVIAEALDVLASGEPRMVTFGYKDDDAFAVGLTCGGTIEVFIEPFDWVSTYRILCADVAAQRPVVVVTVVSGPKSGAKLLVRYDNHKLTVSATTNPTVSSSNTTVSSSGSPSVEVSSLALPDCSGATGSSSGMPENLMPELSCQPVSFGTLGSEKLDQVVKRDALAWLSVGRSGVRHYGLEGEARKKEITVFVHSFSAPPRMLLFGAIDFTSALAKVAQLVGYRVTVCDAREIFATSRRFPMADEVVVSWPQDFLASVGSELGAGDAVCVLTHDPKFDVPAITSALATQVGYIGVMGSRRTHEDRTARLIAAGVTRAGLGRLRSPIGLDIGAITPEETAISIMAEIIAERTGREVKPLSLTRGPIHK